MAPMSRQMGTRPNGGNGGNMVRGASFAAAKGTALIVLAVVIGVVLLRVVDDGSDPQVGAPAEEEATETTTTVASTGETTGEDTTDETAPTGEQLTPDQLTVRVYNGGAERGAARTKSDELRVAGYTNQGEPTDWQGRSQDGDLVMCREGLEREAAALAVAVASSPLVEVMSDPPPPDSDDYNCVVVVGAAT
jgi:hypothetical protein